MLTLNEIRNVNFRKANFGGYRAEDVEAFIDEVQLSYDTLLRENAELVKKLEVLAAKLEEYQSEEDSIRNALMNAQKVGDASLRDAKHKAEIILKDATIKAEKIVSNAQTEIHRERDIIERMQRDIAEFKTKLLRAYKDHLTLINNLPTDEIMRPETKEMADSVQMLDRRAVAPSYDRPGQSAASSNVRMPQGMPAAAQPMGMPQNEPQGMGMPQPAQTAPQQIPQFEENFGEEATAVTERAAVPADPFAASAPAPAPEPGPGDTLPRMETPIRRRPMASPRGGGAMPMTEKPVQRKGGFTVDIDDTSSASYSTRSPMPAPNASRRDPFAEDITDTAAMNDAGGQDGGEMGTPASLFNRRR